MRSTEAWPALIHNQFNTEISMHYMKSLSTPGTLAQVAQVLTLEDALCLAAAGCLKS